MLLWIGVILAVAGIVAAGVWWAMRPQVITFSDDAQLTLLGVEYGKKHTPPTVKAPSGTRTRRGTGFTSTNDTLVIWIQQKYDSKQWHSFQYYVYDKAASSCVQTYPRNFSGGRNGNEVVGVQIDAFPRRTGKFIVRVQEQGNGGQEMSEQKFVIHNPAKSSPINWAPEPLPSTKDDDDVTVTLKSFTTGAKMPYTRNNDDEDDAANKGVQAAFHVERNGKSVSNWQPVSVETRDATGNYVSGWIGNNQWQDGDDTVTYQYALWPDEPAWKVRWEFSQQSDFSDKELWSAQGIPVQPGKQQDFYNFGGGRRQPTNAPAVAETDLNGYHVKILGAKEFTDVPANSQPQGGLSVQITPPLADGMRMTLVQLTDDQTNDISHWDYGNFRNNNTTVYRYGLRDVAGATNLNLTLALHRSRYVEFAVKPQKAPEAAQ